MSLIHILEQLGANSALRQLSAEELSVALNLSASQAQQLQSAVNCNPQQLAELFKVHQYNCIVQVPAEEEESEEQPEQEKSIQTIYVH